MSIRCRWYRLHLPGGKSHHTEFLRYADRWLDASHRFQCLNSSVEVSRFRFLWPDKVIVTRLDADGNPTVEEITSVRIIDFEVFNADEILFMRVENPTRNLRDLFNALEAAFGLGFTCKAVTFEKRRPASVVERVDASHLVGLRVSGAIVERNMAARFEFSSEAGINMAELPEIKEMRYTVDQTEHNLFHQGLKAHMVISSSGLIKLSGALSPLILHLIEEELPSLI